MFCGNCGTKIDDKAKFCSECGTEVDKAVASATEKSNQRDGDGNIKQLDERLQRLEKLGVNHPKLINRAFTVWGYYILAQLIVGVVIFFLALIFGFFAE